MRLHFRVFGYLPVETPNSYCRNHSAKVCSSTGAHGCGMILLILELARVLFLSACDLECVEPYPSRTVNAEGISRCFFVAGEDFL